MQAWPGSGGMGGRPRIAEDAGRSAMQGRRWRRAWAKTRPNLGRLSQLTELLRRRPDQSAQVGGDPGGIHQSGGRIFPRAGRRPPGSGVGASNAWAAAKTHGHAPARDRGCDGPGRSTTEGPIWGSGVRPALWRSGARGAGWIDRAAGRLAAWRRFGRGGPKGAPGVRRGREARRGPVRKGRAARQTKRGPGRSRASTCVLCVSTSQRTAIKAAGGRPRITRGSLRRRR